MLEKSNNHIKTVFFILVLLQSSCTYSLRKKATINSFKSSLESPLANEKIYWGETNYNGEVVNKGALFIPVYVTNYEKTFYMQLDLGSNRTILYKKSIQSIFQWKKIQDNYIICCNQKLPIIDMKINTDFGETTNTDSSFIVIGTIGYDFFINKNVELDFVNDSIRFYTDFSKELTSNIVEVKRAKTKLFPILLPVQIDKREYTVLFDTGSSNFTFFTSTKILNNISNDSCESEFTINAWGNEWAVCSNQFLGVFSIAGINFPTEKLHSSDLFNQNNFLINKVKGVMGNKPFIEKKIYFSTKCNFFGFTH